MGRDVYKPQNSDHRMMISPSTMAWRKSFFATTKHNDSPTASHRLPALRITHTTFSIALARILEARGMDSIEGSQTGRLHDFMFLRFAFSYFFRALGEFVLLFHMH